MPSSQTITSQYSFLPYTKARALQVNANFNNLRGHMLPIDPNTATAADQEYNLGDSTHRWRSAYLTSISLSMSLGSTQVLSGTTAGGFKFVKDATTTMSMLGTNFQAFNATPMAQTITAAVGGFAASAAINLSITSNGNIAGSTCTLTTVGRPVMVGLMNVGNTSGASGLFFRELTTGGITIPVGIKLSYLAGSTTIGSNYVGDGYASRAVAGNTWTYYPSGAFQILHFPSASTYSFSIDLDSTTTTRQNIGLTLENVRLFAFEL